MRPLKNPRVKGPWMPSYNDQTRKRPKMEFIAGAHSMRQQVRNLRARCRVILDSTDPAVVMMGDRVIDAVRHEPDQEYSTLHLIAAGLDAHDDTGESWPVCMGYLLDKFDEIAARDHDVKTDTETPDQRMESGTSIGRLLRKLVPRALRPRNETPASASEHQRHSAGDAQSGTCDATTADSRANDRA